MTSLTSTASIPFDGKQLTIAISYVNECIVTTVVDNTITCQSILSKGDICAVTGMHYSKGADDFYAFLKNVINGLDPYSTMGITVSNAGYILAIKHEDIFKEGHTKQFQIALPIVQNDIIIEQVDDQIVLYNPENKYGKIIEQLRNELENYKQSTNEKIGLNIMQTKTYIDSDYQQYNSRVPVVHITFNKKVPHSQLMIKAKMSIYCPGAGEVGPTNFVPICKYGNGTEAIGQIQSYNYIIDDVGCIAILCIINDHQIVGEQELAIEFMCNNIFYEINPIAVLRDPEFRTYPTYSTIKVTEIIS